MLLKNVTACGGFSAIADSFYLTPTEDCPALFTLVYVEQQVVFVKAFQLSILGTLL